MLSEQRQLAALRRALGPEFELATWARCIQEVTQRPRHIELVLTTDTNEIAPDGVQRVFVPGQKHVHIELDTADRHVMIDADDPRFEVTKK